jgi:hypothetical protein
MGHSCCYEPISRGSGKSDDFLTNDCSAQCQTREGYLNYRQTKERLSLSI